MLGNGFGALKVLPALLAGASQLSVDHSRNQLLEVLACRDAQEYLAQKQRAQTRAALAAQAETSTTKNDAARLSVEVARRAHTTAMMALIFSVGAMLAAIAAAVLAFLALRGATISW
jgi:hypothetical protein